MHLASVKICNYRSIRNLELNFSQGKNVIVGKNNSGKSNVIRAIDLVLGEGSPSYEKSENITENDFYGADTSRPIVIFCELHRSDGEELNYPELGKSFGFRVIDETLIDGLRTHSSQLPKFKDDPQPFADYVVNLFRCFSDDAPGDSRWITPKNLAAENFRGLRDEFDDIYEFALGFVAFVDAEATLRKDARLLFRPGPDQAWKVCNRAHIRNELLTSAIIPSFRDPGSQLRLNHWSWYGKLIRNSVDFNDDGLARAFGEVRAESSRLFETLSSRFRGGNFEKAFPNTTIAFQFNPDTKIDVYKSAQIYVDDGFNSLLQDKGAGIQSAVIIELFSYYTRNFAHQSTSLLAIEEPELYLHPQARRVLSNQLDAFIDNGKNQVILSTHSPEFISTASEELNVHIIRKSPAKGTHGRHTEFKDSKERQILLRRENAEMFFADKVLLVEGGDKYIVEALSRDFAATEFGIAAGLSSNWIDSLNFSVIACGGKTEFWKYYKKLRSVSIESFVIADFDFFRNGLAEFFTKYGPSAREFSQRLNTLKGEMGPIDGAKTITDIPIEFQERVREFISALETKNIFILECELEENYSPVCRGLLTELHRTMGKQEKPIVIVSELVSAEHPITDLVNPTGYFRIFECINSENG